MILLLEYFLFKLSENIDLFGYLLEKFLDVNERRLRELCWIFGSIDEAAFYATLYFGTINGYKSGKFDTHLVALRT